MKRIIFCLLFLALSFSLNTNLASVGRAEAAQIPAWNTDTRVKFFYEDLRPYGEWFWHQKYGWCWYPNNVAVDWRPYSEGYWVYTDYGWEWVSEVPWGWACFHYGRWFYDDTYGWCWYPDTIWAPSWCCWRYGEDWIGWACLPPEAVWIEGRGLRFSDHDADDFIPRHAFCFVRHRDLLDRDLRHRIVDTARNATIFNHTNTFVKNIRFANGRIENDLPIQDKLEKTIGHPISRLRVTTVDSPARRGITKDEVRIFRPEATAPQRQTTGRVEQGNYQGLERQPAPQELKQRHEAETQALQESQASRKKALEEEHAREMQGPPRGITQEQLKQQHQAEINMFQEQANRERQMLQNYHGREQRMMTAPQAQPQQHFNLPAPSIGLRGAPGGGVGGGVSRGGGDGGERSGDRGERGRK